MFSFKQSSFCFLKRNFAQFLWIEYVQYLKYNKDASDFCGENARCSVRVFERYSVIGGNRVSLNVTLFQNGDEIHLSAISSGGSQALFWKINTLGENAFLDKLRELL